ncbi:hypothetical protein [Sulfitobacter geojensis]|uniref:hypothetical protein n=1 Tax=Sulfitobacter geojensis TaxID=1342299 RepID=UPI000568C7C7
MSFFLFDSVSRIALSTHIFCHVNLATNRHQVVRHLCHNRRCVNPGHLTIGDRRDNLNDDRDRRANGVDWRALN